MLKLIDLNHSAKLNTNAFLKKTLLQSAKRTDKEEERWRY